MASSPNRSSSMSQMQAFDQIKLDCRRAILGASPLWATFAGVLSLSLLIAPSPCAYAAGQSFFFATREACVASGMFNERECENAFADAQNELLGRAAEMRGIEIFGLGNAVVTVPVLAVANPPGAFRVHPIHRVYVKRAPPQQLVVGDGHLPADHSNPYNSHKVLGGGAPFPAESDGDTQSTVAKSRPEAALSYNSDAAKAKRRERLKNAPFIE